MSFRISNRHRRLMADISALADGSIAPERREQVEQRIAVSAELRSVFEAEEAVAAMLRQLRERDRAPDALRQRIAQEQLARSGPVRRQARLLAASVLAATAAVCVTALLVLAGGTTGGPSVAEAAGLALRGAIAPAPPVNPHDRHALMQGVGTVSFPNWGGSTGWFATGQRIDHLGGRRAVTVYYAWEGQHVAYTIVSVPPLALPRAEVVTEGGLHLHVLAVAGRQVVTWRRDGRTCVLSSGDASVAQLETLAAWRASRTA